MEANMKCNFLLYDKKSKRFTWGKKLKHKIIKSEKNESLVFESENSNLI